MTVYKMYFSLDEIYEILTELVFPQDMRYTIVLF